MGVWACGRAGVLGVAVPEGHYDRSPAPGAWKTVHYKSLAEGTVRFGAANPDGMFHRGCRRLTKARHSSSNVRVR
jgi:hypothetical protein